MTPHDFASELCALALQIERAGDDPEALILARLEFEALWCKFRKDTQKTYDDYVVEAKEEHAALIAQDLDLGPRLQVVKGKA